MTKKAHHGEHGGITEDTEKDFLIRVVASTMPGGHATGGGRMLSMDHPVAVLQDEYMAFLRVLRDSSVFSVVNVFSHPPRLRFASRRVGN
jgi:hypothetical protein